MAALNNGQVIIFCSCGFYLLSFFFLLFSAPNLSGLTLHVYHTLSHDGAFVRILECMREMCYMRLAGNTRRKIIPKNRYLRTIAQLCLAISSQLRHVSTIREKLVKQQYLLQMSS